MKRRDEEKTKKRNRLLSISVFVCYSMLMLWLLFGQRAAGLNRMVYDSSMSYSEQVKANAVLVPFRTTAELVMNLFSADAQLVRQAVINLGGNIIMFMPLGFLLPCVFSRIDSAVKCLLCTAIIISAVEVIQLFTLLGFCDIDDLIFNVCGSLFGFLMWKTAAEKRKTEKNVL